MIIDVEVNPKEYAVKAGKVRFEAGRAVVYGEEVDTRFALLAMVDERALDLYRRLMEAPLKDWVKESLMDKAVSSGVEAAAALLEEYLAKRPNGEVRILRGEEWTSAVDIGDGEKFVEVPVADGVALDFPVNVYAEPSVVQSFGAISGEELEKIREDAEGFFRFALRVAAAEVNAARIGLRRVLEEACREYFADRKRAEEILEGVEREVLLYKVGEEVLDEVAWRGILEVAGGYLVRTDSGKVFFVDGNGGVYKMSRSEGARTARAVGFLAVEKRVPPGSTKNIDGGDLINVARAVGAVRPDLAVVIAP